MTSLSLIGQAKSKDAVGELFEHAMRHRHNLIMAPTEPIEDNFNVKSSEAAQLIHDVHQLIRDTMSSGLEITGDGVKSLCDESIDPKIVKLVAKIIVKQAPRWKAIMSQQRIAWPRLLNMEWRVDMKTASQAVSRMSVPTVVLGLTVEEQPKDANKMPQAQTVNFELSREALQTMLTGMKQIATQLDQLSGSGSGSA
jgi:hypothetical protein|tara:strand:+ start:100 stop:690 length:591 start_codon:yes stop_codon:yes gene_type:complete